MFNLRSQLIPILAVLLLSLLHACQKNEVQGLTTQNLTLPSCQLRSSNYIFDAGSQWVYQNDSTGELIQVKVRNVHPSSLTESENPNSTCTLESKLSPATFDFMYSNGDFLPNAVQEELATLPRYWDRSEQLNDTLFHPKHGKQLFQTPRKGQMKVGSLVFTEVDEVVQLSNGGNQPIVRRDFYSPRVGLIKWVSYPKGSAESYSLISYQTILWEEH